MKTLQWRELAKFGSGFEAFHAVAHAYLAFTHVNLTILGFTQSHTWNVVSAVVHAGVAVLLGRYAWRARP